MTIDNSYMDKLLSGDYPDTWDEYVGQARAKRSLMVASHSAAKRGKNLAHTLIYSPLGGSGKTALVQLTIRQMNRRVHTVSGALNLAKARIMFSQVSDGDVIFYDEFHKVMDGGKKNAEWLLHYLENGVLVTPFGEEKVPSVTIMGATTDKGLIPDTILQRLVVIELEEYTAAEGAQIVSNLSQKILAEAVDLPTVRKDVAEGIAAAASNQPRMMRKILHAVRDLATVDMIEIPDDGAYDLEEALDMVDVTPDGLTKEAREYLRLLYTEMRGEPAGEAHIKRRMGLVGKGLQMVESLLHGKGLIAFTKQGRMLTGEGIKRTAALETAA
jgi:Holliday junction DNA helicase RuvB